ncbi:hypothetical protein [Ideonella sp. BN130291]|uniref:hypothetical protein n=1 Tax=Ideonella sp. BN130291 TaxID=3112940 RepID=UPI002E258CAC|nr:hypothetical protein [Ideonella sp. BN130291]
MTRAAFSLPPHSPAAAALHAPVHAALRRLALDTLQRLGTLDVTDRLAVQLGLNLLERLLAVLDEPAPQVEALADALRMASATTRPTVAAALYREFAALAAARFGITPAALPDD